MKSKEKDFPISDYPLLQTEFLYESKKGTADIISFVYALRNVDFLTNNDLLNPTDLIRMICSAFSSTG